MNLKIYVRMIFTIFISLLEYLVGGFDNGIKTLLIFMFTDIITGVMKACVGKSEKSLNGHLKSYVMWKGGIKKALIIIVIYIIYQTGGEFNEKFETKDLTIVTKLPKEAVLVYADGRQLYRVIENLYNNVAKYALPETRVYVELVVDGENAVFSIKNVSERSLARENAAVEDLTERFIRGDESRTTEGSGLGLSIAKNLTQLMKGQFLIGVDGDLFKATIIFPLCNR